LFGLRGCLLRDRFGYVIIVLLVVEFMELLVIMKKHVVDNGLDDGSIDYEHQHTGG
jgi:hypothetical protein